MTKTNKITKFEATSISKDFQNRKKFTDELNLAITVIDIKKILKEGLTKINLSRNKRLLLESILDKELQSEEKEGILLYSKKLLIQNPSKNIEAEIKREIGTELSELGKTMLRKQQSDDPIKWIEAELDYDENLKRKNITGLPFTQLKWLSKDTHLLELIDALIENESIAMTGLTKNQVINSFEGFFNIKIKTPAQKLSKAINNRNNDSTALFLDALKKAFLKSTQKKMDKKEKKVSST
jgi:hypothetical protein